MSPATRRVFSVFQKVGPPLLFLPPLEADQAACTAALVQLAPVVKLFFCCWPGSRTHCSAAVAGGVWRRGSPCGLLQAWGDGDRWSEPPMGSEVRPALTDQQLFPGRAPWSRRDCFMWFQPSSICGGTAVSTSDVRVSFGAAALRALLSPVPSSSS